MSWKSLSTDTGYLSKDSYCKIVSKSYNKDKRMMRYGTVRDLAYPLYNRSDLRIGRQ
jgi:hypothetical protein